MQQQQSDNRKPKPHYTQPEGFITRFFWRLWMKLSVTFALSMLETWEIVFIFIITGVTAALVTVGFVRFFPQTISLAVQRAHYYLSGSDADVQLGMTGWAGAAVEKLGAVRVDL